MTQQEQALLEKKVSEYRRILNDYSTSDSAILKRLDYLDALCRSIIRTELENYVSKTHAK